MTDTVTSTLDLLAIACIERPNDFAAWAALCDYCEENRMRYHPRALAWVITNRGVTKSDEAVNDLTERLAYGGRWGTHDCSDFDGKMVDLQFMEWAVPLARSVRKRSPEGKVPA